MPFSTQIANNILVVARKQFPDSIGNLEHLKDLTGIQTTDTEWSSALRALEAEGLVEFQTAVRTGVDKYFRGFVNMTVTPKGRATNLV